MKKIVTVCGQGLGSSLIVELNVKQALETLGVSADYAVTHENLNTYSPGNYDIVICGQDIAPNVAVDAKSVKLVLVNIMDVQEVTAKLKAIIENQ